VIVRGAYAEVEFVKLLFIDEILIGYVFLKNICVRESVYRRIAMFLVAVNDQKTLESFFRLFLFFRGFLQA